MSQQPSIKMVEESDDFIHVRFRDPDQFETIRTPDWAANAAGSVVSGAEVRTGKSTDSDDWVVQSILVPKDVGEEAAMDKAKQIFTKIES